MEEAGTFTAPDAETVESMVWVVAGVTEATEATEAMEAVKGESLGRIATVTRVCTVSAFVL